MKDLTNKKGTIAHYLTQHQNEIYACGNDVEKMKKITLKLLESEDLKSNPVTLEAIDHIKKSKGNKFLSLLVTYMTGMKVGI